MYVTALPMLVELPVGQAAQIAVTITNTTSIIDAYTVRAFGLDPQWLTVDAGPPLAVPRRGRTSSRSPSRCRRTSRPGCATIAVHVQSENDPQRVHAGPDRPRRRDPVAHHAARRPRDDHGGNSAQFALVVANEGNATVQARPMGVDPEDVARHRLRAGDRRAVAGPAGDHQGRRPRRPTVVRAAQAAGAVVQPRTRRAAGDGHVRAAAADRPLAHLAARPRHRRRDLRAGV